MDQADGLREIMKDRKPSGETKQQKTRIISVSSGKGGVGKTNLSINLAIAYAKLGKKVIVLDADLGLANVNVILGVIPKYNLYHIIRRQKTMKEIIIETSYGISIVAGASGFFKIANLEEEERKWFISELSELSSADIIIIDTSAGVSSNVLAFVAAADDVIIVTTPEPTAITDAYGIVKIIATEMDAKDLNLKLIVNRVKSVTQGKKVSERVIAIANQFLNIKVDYLGYVYDDPAVSAAVIKQKPFLADNPSSKASICITDIANRLEKSEFSEGSGLNRFIKRLFGRL
ncbi:MAG: MinD/ParA family protein [Spirochaetales bacterium]|jgi:flagellar biosynthesis protein FlhG|nr:MinD/ParA family protein [Spirochaetales bacterium]